MIQVQRQDFNGRMLTIRRDDLRAIACILDTSRREHRRPARAPRALPDRLSEPAAPPSASTSTSRSAPGAATTARSPRGPTAPTWSTSTSPPAAARSSGPWPPACRRPPASSSAAARRRSCRPPPWCGCSRPSRWPPGAEVTVECNPDTVTAELVATYGAGGVNRLSFGVQSMVPHVLAVPRPHPRRRQRAALASSSPAAPASRRSTSTSSTAPPARPSTTGAAPSTAVLALDPPHVTAYALTVEAGTPLAADPARHPDDDDQADKYLLASDACCRRPGSRWYEISNWARPGHECRHNLLYWCQGDYLGFGCAAHSHRRRPAVVERAHARALHRRGATAASRTEAAGEELDADDPRRSRRCSSRSAPAPACPPTPSTPTTLRGLDGLVEAPAATGGCSPRGPAAHQRGGAPPAG